MRNKGTDRTDPKKYADLKRKQMTTPSRTYDQNYVRIQYVRYADDFIIGVEGGLDIAKQILAEVTIFVTEVLGLKLNETKTGIVKIKEKECGFLGYHIRAPYKSGSSRGVVTIREPNSGKLVPMRAKERIGIKMDDQKVLNRLAGNHFITKRLKPGSNDEVMYRGVFRGNLVNLDHVDILRYYSAVIRGIYNYYKTVNNPQRLARIVWLLIESCGLTLAKKYKLRTLRQVFCKFGKGFATLVRKPNNTEQTVKLWTPESYKRQPRTSLMAPQSDPMKLLGMS